MYQKFSLTHVSFTCPDCFPVFDDCGDFSGSGSLEVSTVGLRGVTAGFLPGGGNKQTKNKVFSFCCSSEKSTSHTLISQVGCVCVSFFQETFPHLKPTHKQHRPSDCSSVNFESDVLSFYVFFFSFLKLCTTLK